MIGRLSDGAITASIGPTLRALYDAPDGEWSRQVVAQLIAVVEYERERAPDPEAARTAVLVAALDDLAGNALVPVAGSPDERASAALVAAVGREDPGAEAVRSALRPVLVAELDDELASTMVMLEGFRGRIRGG